ncbi:hypothetical protein [Sphingomonas sp. BK580]|uniref:hypothetical protein n=1 Tax=Sphingomonas sp. BK580 TaxID=2586972 RepID=UPI00161B4662|nr:hypothetical protein [Sphingomonas sp. BK580]MBB3693167.1 hypothetical protein [Sphingomonas sp. BK580]
MRLGLGLLAGAFLLMPPPASAQESFSRAVGGAGGRPFTLRCPANTHLTGLSSLQGAYINFIAPICDGQVQHGAGGRGERRDASCPSGMYFSTMIVQTLRSDNRLVKAVKMLCGNDRREVGEAVLRSPGPYSATFYFFGHSSPYPVYATGCDHGRAIGLHGRSGAAIDALGLICEK